MHQHIEGVQGRCHGFYEHGRLHILWWLFCDRAFLMAGGAVFYHPIVCLKRALWNMSRLHSQQSYPMLFSSINRSQYQPPQAIRRTWWYDTSFSLQCHSQAAWCVARNSREDVFQWVIHRGPIITDSRGIMPSASSPYSFLSVSLSYLISWGPGEN